MFIGQPHCQSSEAPNRKEHDFGKLFCLAELSMCHLYHDRTASRLKSQLSRSFAELAIEKDSELTTGLRIKTAVPISNACPGYEVGGLWWRSTSDVCPGCEVGGFWWCSTSDVCPGGRWEGCGTSTTYLLSLH